MASKPRAIDLLPTLSPRPVEMQVLCLGLSRTSTWSLCEALNKLGYNSYHMKEVFVTPNRATHLNCWHEALRAKRLGIGKEYGKAEFEKLLGQYSAVTDAPCVNFAEELLEAYPEAKVVLSVRDPEKWLPSMERSYYQILGWPSFRLLAVLNPVIHVYSDLLISILKQWTGGEWDNRHKLKQGFLDHNEKIRGLVPRDRLLEFRAEQGWLPLCEFLGKKVPDEPYPRANQGENTANIHVGLMKVSYSMMVGKYLLTPVAVGVGAWWLMRGGGGAMLGKFGNIREILEKGWK